MLRYTLRTLAASPGFTAVAIATLALGIGANTAIFTAIHHLLFRPFPFLEQPERLVAVWQVAPRGNDHNEVTAADFRDWRENLKSFDRLVSHVWWTGNITGGERPERVQGMQVSVDYFDAFELKPALGRTFTPGEDQPGNDRVVMLSWGLWQRRFGGDRGVLGTVVSINGISRTVIGVMPEGVRYPIAAEMWAPYAPTPETWTSRRLHYLYVTGRLAPGVTLAAARAEITRLTAARAIQYPNTNTNWGANVRPLMRDTARDIEPMLAVLMAAVAFVLLIACANVANLMLVRATSRGRELSIRTALGASRGSIVRLVLAEGVVLALAGGALGALLGVFGVDLLRALVPADFRQRIAGFDRMRVNATVLAFTAVLSIGSALLFALLPALRAARGAVGARDQLRSGQTTEGRERHRLRRVLVGAEVALALLLLIGAGLTLRTFRHLGTLPPGFETSGVALTSLALPGRTYAEGTDAARFYSRLVERVGALPGVAAAGATNVVPLCGCNQTSSFNVVGQPPYPTDDRPDVGWRIITPGYFDALRVPIQRGRDFTATDAAGAPSVVIVNETLARRWFPDGAVGKRLFLQGDTTQPAEIVGIVGDIKHAGIGKAAAPEMFLPEAQQPAWDMTLTVRAAGGEAAATTLLPALRSAVLELDPNQPVYDQQTMRDLLALNVLQYRFSLRLMATLGLIALLLAGVGIYGVISNLVAERTREIGIRIALGGDQQAVRSLVVRQGMSPAAIGVLAGLVLAPALTMLVRGMLVGVSPHDPLTFVAVGLLLLLVALFACWLPARRAARVDPMIALRTE
ncbi:MAG TPA: ABC transporter permease [Gemmatimonadales bacterium]|nr:ABC transporter permease [Gemmatimonadales bacterium]